MAPVGRFLPALTERLVTTAQHDPPLTLDFVDTMSKVIPIFDHLGSTLSFAKSDIVAKNDSLRVGSAQYDTLKNVVDADKKTNTVTTKNSLARNLHRLRTVVVFMEKIMANLVSDPKTPLSTAVSSAYGETLSAYHSMIVRGTCNAGFLLLPNRTSFLASLGETEETAKAVVEKFIAAAQKVVADVDKLYDVEMPASTAWM